MVNLHGSASKRRGSRAVTPTKRPRKRARPAAKPITKRLTIPERLVLLEMNVKTLLTTQRGHRKLLWGVLASVWLDILAGHRVDGGEILNGALQMLSSAVSAHPAHP